MKFEVGKLYRNDGGKDMDIRVIDISYTNEKYTKLTVAYVFRTTKKWNGVYDNVIIYSKYYDNWYEVKENLK